MNEKYLFSILSTLTLPRQPIKKLKLVGLIVPLFISLVGCQTTKHNTDITHLDIQKFVKKPTDTPPRWLAPKKNLSHELINHEWFLVSAVDRNNQHIKELLVRQPAVLNFSSSNQNNVINVNYNLSIGCNTMRAPAQLLNNSLISRQLQSTEKYCGQLNTAENKLAQLMQGVSKISMSNQQVLKVTQITAQGSTLIWTGLRKNKNVTPTRRTHTLNTQPRNKDIAHVQAKETIFLEVDAETYYCSSAINKQCFKVRQINYNQGGLKIGSQPWLLMKQKIKGYHHSGNSRNILRIDKYVTNPPNVKGKQVVYILDSVIETANLNNQSF